jgi:hypothetical protein
LKIELRKICGSLSAVACLFFLFAFYRLALVGFISDSEIWAINLAKHIHEEWLHPWVFTRPLFYGLLALFVAPADDPITIFQYAKIFGIINATAIFVLTFAISQTLCSRRWKWVTPFIAIFLLVSNGAFLNQGYRIRSDLLASTLLLLSIYLTLKINPARWFSKVSIWLLPVLATPKALLFILPFAFFKGEKKSKLLPIYTALIAAILTIVIYPQSLKYLVSLFFERNLWGSYLSRESFYYVERAIEKNTLFFSIFLFRFLFLFLRMQSAKFDSELKKEQTRFFQFFTLGSVIILIVGPEKTPFFVAAFLPVFSIFASSIFEDMEIIASNAIVPRLRNLFEKIHLAGAAICFFSLSISAHLAWTSFLKNNNKTELYETISHLNNYLQKYPKATQYDVVGLIPNRSTIREFAGPNDPVNNKNTVDRLKVFLPHIIFYVRKGILLEPELSILLREHYNHIGSGAYAKWEYFGKWLEINAKNSKIIAEFTKQKFMEVGAEPSSSVFVMLKDKKSKIWIQESTIENLLVISKKSKGIKIAGISIFKEIESHHSPLVNTVGFDWDQ